MSTSNPATNREERTLSGRIKIAMAQCGIRTPAELARKMKVGRQTVYRWVNEEGDQLTPDMLFRLSDALNVNARWLALGPPNSPVKPTAIDPDTNELLQLKATLEAVSQDAKEEWISTGRRLVRLLAPASPANPFASSTTKRK